MIKQIVGILLFLLTPCMTWADDVAIPDTQTDTIEQTEHTNNPLGPNPDDTPYDIATFQDRLEKLIAAANVDEDASAPENETVEQTEPTNNSFRPDPDNTPCATAAFQDGLARLITAANLNEDASEQEIQEQITSLFRDKDILTTVLECPELKSVPETRTIIFLPIKYTFPGGRKIVVNYETQPKLLRQRLQLANKRSAPHNPSPRIGEDDSVWTNTDPSWYAIMVVQHGALDEFVGPDKSNIISLQYIIDNIDKLYPNAASNGGNCTSRSALAEDWCAINKSTKKTVAMEDDTNDYYVAGDINLQWISYAEMALDVVITVATMGGGAVISGITKSARAARALNGMKKTYRALKASDKVKDYLAASQRVAKLTEEINDLEKLMMFDDGIDAGRHAANLAKKMQQLDDVNDTRKKLEQTKDVKEWQNVSKTFSELNQYRRTLRSAGTAVRSAQSGNVIARTVKIIKGARAARNGAKLIAKGARIAGRSSNIARRTLDYLIHSSLKSAAVLSRAASNIGFAYTAVKFIGDLYDYTDVSTGEFTNGEDFKPLLLLSADDLKGDGQENKVNYGMWLMWEGDTYSRADDDAAYLQAMDFATKFYLDLSEYQGYNASPCNIDIYVVHPILRNPGTDPELYYLIMNDVPWSTANSKDLLDAE